MRYPKQVLQDQLLVTNKRNSLSGQSIPKVPDGWHVIGITLTLLSAAFTLANLDRIVVKAGEWLAMDINPTGTYKYLQRLTERFARMRADPVLDTDTSIYLPFNLLDRLEDNAQDVCSLPDKELSIDLEIIGGPVAPTINVGLVLTNVAQGMWPQYLGWNLNAANGVKNASPTNPPANGLVRALLLPNPATAAAAPSKWVVKHAQAGDLVPGSTPAQLLCMQKFDDKQTDTSVIVLPIGGDNGVLCGKNDLELVVDTGTTTLVGVEGVLWQTVPVAPAKAA